MKFNQNLTNLSRVSGSLCCEGVIKGRQIIGRKQTGKFTDPLELCRICAVIAGRERF